MPLSLGPNEAILWQGKPVQSLRGMVLTVLTFLIAIAFAGLGPGGVIAGAFFFFLFFVFLIFSTWSILQLRGINYYITNERVVRQQVMFSKKGGELSLQHLSTVRVSQSFVNRLRGIGYVHFDSTGGRGVVFVRVKDPEVVRQGAINAKARLMSVQPVQPMTREIIRETVLIQCRHCGARSTQGTTRCPQCGANL